MFMLLRRVMEHVREQNWIAVWLDLFIVVIGVFIGIQVSNWNDQRQSKAELAASLENLAQEISNTATRREDQLQWQHRIIRGYQLMLDLLDGAALDDEERAEAYRALTVGYPPPDPSRYETLYELQSTGHLKDISSKELRGALGELLSRDRMGTDYYDYWATAVSAPPYSPDIVTFGQSENGASGVQTLIVTDVDLELARNNPAFRARINQMLEFYRVNARNDASGLRIDQIILEMLESAGYRPSGNWLEENRDRLTANPKDKN
jgi:hypothetical protein